MYLEDLEMKHVNKVLLAVAISLIAIPAFTGDRLSVAVAKREACMDKHMPVGKEITYDALVKACPPVDWV